MNHSIIKAEQDDDRPADGLANTPTDGLAKGPAGDPADRPINGPDNGLIDRTGR